MTCFLLQSRSPNSTGLPGTPCKCPFPQRRLPWPLNPRWPLPAVKSWPPPKAFCPSGSHYGLQHLLCLLIIITLFSFYVGKILTCGDVCLISQPSSPPVPGTEQPPLARVFPEVTDAILVTRTWVFREHVPNCTFFSFDVKKTEARALTLSLNSQTPRDDAA